MCGTSSATRWAAADRTIRTDPEYNNGNYNAQPRILKIANVFYATGTHSGNLALQKAAPTRAQAGKLVETRLAAPMMADANDYYIILPEIPCATAPGLDRIKAVLLAINAAEVLCKGTAGTAAGHRRSAM